MTAITFHDKLVVGGIGLMMVCNNYSFFLAYWDLWSELGLDTACKEVSFWVGFETILCLITTILVCGMVLGAWIDGYKQLDFWTFFVAHAVGGLCYTLAVIKLGASIYSQHGEICTEQNPGASSRFSLVFIAQAVLYVPYWLGMAVMFHEVAIKKGIKHSDEKDKKSSDNLVVAGFGLLMLVQNYSFFFTYWDLWSQTISDPACSGATYWFAFNTFVCLYVTWMVCGMVLGAWIDGSREVWWGFFVAHLVGGLCYTVAVVKLGVALFGSDGEACSESHQSTLQRGHAVYITQATLYPFYVGCMYCLSYEVVFKMNGASGSFRALKA